MGHLVSPSLLAANFGQLDKDIGLINNSSADWLHLDIMDGVFVPNITFGFPVIKFINQLSTKPLDVHLMIIDPDRYLSRFRDVGAKMLTVHYEACTHLNRTVNEIRNLGMKSGVALNPHSPIAGLKSILPYIDMVLLMTVNPGYGGQSFIDGSYQRISELRKMINDGNYEVMIEVDGGVDTKNARRLVETGVDVLIAGSSVFGSSDPVDTVKKLKGLMD